MTFVTDTTKAMDKHIGEVAEKAAQWYEEETKRLENGRDRLVFTKDVYLPIITALADAAKKINEY